MKRLSLLLLSLCAVVAASAAADGRKVASKAERVTLFMNGAQVSRTVQVDLPAGESKLVFTGLSPYLDEKSLQVSGRGDFVITAVDRRYNYTDSVAWTRSMAEIESERKSIARELAEVKAGQEVVEAETEMLKTNCSVANRTEATSLAAVRELTEYYAGRLRELKADSRRLKERAQSLQARADAASRRASQLGGRPKKPVSEIVVAVDAAAACRASFDLTYYVGGAGWYPTYDVRSAGLTSPVRIACRANVYQNTREEWTDVALTLSSSNPSRSNVVPQLRTWWLDYGVSAPYYGDRSASSEVTGAVVDRRTGEPLVGASVLVPGSTVGTSTDADGRFAITMPDGADRLQFAYVGYKGRTLRASAGSTVDVGLDEDRAALSDVVVTGYGESVKAKLSGKVMGIASAEFDEAEVVVEEQLAANTSMARDVVRRQTPAGYEFAVNRPYTIPSDGKAVTAEIGLYSLPASYVYESTPRIEPAAFLMASVTGWERLDLLEGEANVWFENTFVGKSILSPSVRSDTLCFAMGRDRGIVVTREKIDRSRSRRTIGSTQTQEAAWRLTVRNTRADSVSLHLRDQVPVSANAAVTVTVEESEGAAVSAAGFVTWDMSLAPGEQRDVVLRYRVKYPKERNIDVE